MKNPGILVLELTAMQAKSLEDHFAYVNKEASAGRKGILCAQIYSPNDRHADAGCMRVGFMHSEKAAAVAVDTTVNS